VVVWAVNQVAIYEFQLFGNQVHIVVKTDGRRFRPRRRRADFSIISIIRGNP
jgi:hypothetical protein